MSAHRRGERAGAAPVQLDFGEAWLTPPASRKPAPAEKPTTPKQGRDGALEHLAQTLLLALGEPVLEILADEIEVCWNRRLATTAGRALLREARVELNPRLEAFGAEEIDRTLRHELAHLVAWFRASARRIPQHGRQWRKACRDLGIPGERARHTLPLPRRAVARPFLYRCPGCGLEVRRVKPFRRREACRSCCRKHERGKHDPRFQFARVPAAAPDRKAPPKR